jgi:hypothetical protein
MVSDGDLVMLARAVLAERDPITRAGMGDVVLRLLLVRFDEE